MELDLIIRSGIVIDGTGAAPRPADIGVQGDRITALDDLSGATATTIIDAGGLTVIPGFIDTHTHSDLAAFLPDSEMDVRVAAVRQGVTTEICGNCGFTAFPVLEETRQDTLQHLSILGDVRPDWSTFDEYASRLEEKGIHANLASLVGHGSLRTAVMGYVDRDAQPREVRAMQDLLRQALEQGAVGLSTGLIYAPGVFASTEEITELARVAAELGRPYSTHMRGETDMIVRSVEEALTIGRRSGAPVHISHHKTAGRANWGRTNETLAILDVSRHAGQDVTCDVYPYTAGSTMLAALLPAWVRAGGLEPMLERLRDRQCRERITQEFLEPSMVWENLVNAAGWDHISISTCPGRSEYEGRTIDALAENDGRTPADFTFDLIVEQRGQVTMILEMMDEDDVRRVVSYPGSMIGSDGIPLPGKPHPRWAGTFSRVLGRYVREEKLLSLADAVHKMTGFSAERFGLRDRGVLAPGKAADIVVLDPERVADRATYDAPLLSPAGVRHVIVNGVPVVRDETLTGATPGRVLRVR
jgi:N-acyl-D-amino-acid deacylase